jgi:hypothetical protein
MADVQTLMEQVLYGRCSDLVLYGKTLSPMQYIWEGVAINTIPCPNPGPRPVVSRAARTRRRQIMPAQMA